MRPLHRSFILSALGIALLLIGGMTTLWAQATSSNSRAPASSASGSSTTNTVVRVAPQPGEPCITKGGRDGTVTKYGDCALTDADAEPPPTPEAFQHCVRRTGPNGTGPIVYYECPPWHEWEFAGDDSQLNHSDNYSAPTVPDNDEMRAAEPAGRVTSLR